MLSTMDFFTPCYARREAAFRWLAGLFLGIWLSGVVAATAPDKSAVKQAAIQITQQGYVLDADVNIVLNRTLENALTKGINLYFVLELELTRPRNWWFDENIAEPVRKLRIYYHLLLRRYVVETGYTTQTAASLSEALAMLGRVEAWQVLDRGALQPGQRYDARLRLRLDTAQLPKPLSIGAVSGDNWEMTTSWYDWSFEAPATLPSPTSQPLP
ncbi:MAG: DUF4390 domain-containing protein [Sulfuriferula multivorans]|uniref:DUF4390 domain-containing protein n=1 Tax=Sulfuriferula multivorans TaxID=1559896 RepID=A0A7C9JX60_9PROT|nr:DUF4390 domain-containing protein [Sulfuriferula multivorans]